MVEKFKALPKPAQYIIIAGVGGALVLGLVSIVAGLLG